MEQTEEKHLSEDAQEHNSAPIDTQHAIKEVNVPLSEDVFWCKFGQHWVPRIQATKTGKNPSICRVCSDIKQEQKRQQEEEERQAKRATLDEIRAPDGRGSTKRVTYSLHQYVVTALDVLAVGSSPSEVVERAIIRFLEDQDQQVISFINRMFTQAPCK